MNNPEAIKQKLTKQEEIQHEVNEVVESERARSPDQALGLPDVLRQMGAFYRADPEKAVRGQGFIKYLHEYVGSQLEARLTKYAKQRKIEVKFEPTILGSTKPKDIDVAVIDPENGPLVLIGIRSQMSSIGNNILGYYEGIVGECISLQDRFPMSTYGYIYLHPLTSIKEGKQTEIINHARYAQLYATVTGRSGIGLQEPARHIRPVRLHGGGLRKDSTGVAR